MYSFITEKEKKKKFQAVSTTVWVLFESYDLREDNKRGMKL